VVVALLMTGNLPFFRAFLLLLAELGGSIIGAYFANWVTSGVLLGVNKVAPGYNNAQATFAEALLTCCLCLTVLFIIIEKNTLVTFTPFVVGTVIFMCHLIGTHIDGTSINPARSFGPAVVTGEWTSQHWIFWVGPITGALFAVIIYVMFKSLRYEVVNISRFLCPFSKSAISKTFFLSIFFFHHSNPISSVIN
jgi:aquaporin related protein